MKTLTNRNFPKKLAFTSLITILLFFLLTLMTTFAQEPHYSISKSATAQELEVGDIFTYTVTISNTGNLTGELALVDELPPQLLLLTGPLVTEIEPAVHPLSATVINTHTIFWDGSLSPGAVMQIAYQVKLLHCPQPDRNDIRNEAFIDPVEGNEVSAVNEIPVLCAIEIPEVEIAKSASAESLSVGQMFTYTVYLTNTGAMTAEMVMIDKLPAQVQMMGAPQVTELEPTAEPLTATFNPAIGPSGAVEWEGSLSPEAAIQIDFPVKVTHCPLPERTDIRNEAIVYLSNQESTSAVLELETECPEGPVNISKSASVETADVGDVYTYTLTLTNTSNEFSASLFMSDQLPPQVELAGPPLVTELISSVHPLSATFHPGHGPRGTVSWKGTLSPGAVAQISFPVEVVHCPLEAGYIFNKAIIEQHAGTLWMADYASVKVFTTCNPPSEPNITLHKRIAPNPNDDGYEEWESLPGRTIGYRLILEANDNMTHTIKISDPLQAGTIAIAAEATSGDVRILRNGHLVVWEGRVSNDHGPVKIDILVKLREVECGWVIENKAYWFDPFEHRGHSNQTHLKIACHDLGDAPASNNHNGLDMTAYPVGVTANFPTVFDVPAPVGPLHWRPHALHLGPRVSAEIEADRGWDADGVNNIKPLANKANLDEADDGLKRDTLNFEHCQIHRFPVWINVHPRALNSLGPEKTVYLNVWLDSNRDGDWDDMFDDCPDHSEVFEHIVIDQEIDIAALLNSDGPGLHKIMIETTRPVFWPADHSEKPAWLRVTLNDDQKSNKTLPQGCNTAPNCPYGDGRGYANGFELGETEDYLLRGPQEPPSADPAVEKRGNIRPKLVYDPQHPFHGRLVWEVRWRIWYKNLGRHSAQNVIVRDHFDEAQRLGITRSHPHLATVISGTTITYNVGELPAEEGGYIFIRTWIPFTTTPGTVLTNTVTISGQPDSDAANNREVVTQTIPLLRPIITYPTPGTTCTGTLTVTGRVQLGGITVEVFVNEDSVGTTTADEYGHWEMGLNLPDGEHKIQAKAIYGNQHSKISHPVWVVVDSELVWSPLSLRFTSETGHVIIPQDENGRTDVSGWHVPLRPQSTYTVTVFVCCENPGPVTLAVPGGEIITLEDPDGDHWYVGTFTTPGVGSVWEPLEIELCVVCENVQYCSSGEVLIDPEGVVFDVTQGQESGLLQDAIVACYEAQTSLDSGQSIFTLWPAENFNNQVNPQTTANDGYFSFFTPPGTFQLDVNRSGFQSYRSQDIIVVSTPVQHNVPLSPDIADDADHTITLSNLGFEPDVLTVNAGDVIEWINTDTGEHSTMSLSPTTALSNTNGWDSGLLGSGESYKRQMTGAGSYSYQDGENGTSTGLIIVKAGNVVYLPLILK